MLTAAVAESAIRKRKGELGQFLTPYTLLALLDLRPDVPWEDAQATLRGITPVIDFIAKAYGVRYAPNTRETIRDDAVKFFVEAGLLLRNPDDPI